MQPALRNDALATTDSGFSLRIGLPWIRSLPIACVREPRVTIDGRPVGDLRVSLGRASIAADELIDQRGWWFAQDRLVLLGSGTLTPGDHDVAVTFRLLIPYLLAGPGGGPLDLPIRLARPLELDHRALPSVSLDAA